METLTSRERVLRAIRHQPVDRPPMDFFSTPEITERLRAHFGITADRTHRTPLIECPDPDVAQALGCDLRMVAPAYIGPPIEREEDGSWVNLFGVRRRPVPCEGGVYFSYEDPPLRDATLEGVQAHPWPDPDWFDYESLVEQCETWSDYAIVAGYPGNVDYLNKAGTLCGADRVMMGLATGDPALQGIFDQLDAFFYEYNRRTFEAAADRIDIAYFGDDFGAQDRPLISPRMYRKLMQPRWKRYYDLARSHSLIVMHHSCGSVGLLLEDMVEAGVDVLDVVQPDIPGMDLADLKERLACRLVFHGALCVQRVLPQGTADDVRAEVRRVAGILGSGGGYILAPTNKFPSDVPIENVLAMYDECARLSSAHNIR